MASPGEMTPETGTSDAFYNLVSVLYHALQGAETCDQYIADAERSGDEALADYFRRVQEAQRRFADDAKRMLRERIEAMGMGATEAERLGAEKEHRRSGAVGRGGGVRVRGEPEDTVQEASEESFPASDPPAY